MSLNSHIRNYIFSLSGLLNQALPPTTTSTLLSLLLKTDLIPLPNLPAVLLLPSPSPPLLNAVITAFSRSPFPSLALRTFSLLHRLSFPLDSYSFCSSLTAAAASTPHDAAAASTPHDAGAQIHVAALKSSHFASNIFVCGALIDFYAKTHKVEAAQKVFDEIPVKNIVCLNSLLNGYINEKLWTEGIVLVQRIPSFELEPNASTFCGILKICAESAVLGLGVQTHACLMRRVAYAEKDVILSSSLVEMYGKCGLVSKARLVFELAGRGIRRDAVLWTSMLNAYGRNGMFADVIREFEDMLIEKIKPDEVVLLAVLSACRQTGDVAKAMEFLELMRRDYGLVTGVKHNGCVVDMLCKAGEMEKVLEFVSEILMGEIGQSFSRLGIGVWGAILSACRHCGNIEIGKVAALKALELEPHNVGIYMELSNLYASYGMWDDISKLRGLMRDRGLKKHAGFSWLEETL